MRFKRLKISGQIKNISYHWLKILRVIVLRFWKEGFLYRVSALTYTTLLGIVPIFGVLFFFLSMFKVFDHLGLKVQHYIFSNFVPATGILLEKYFSSFTMQATKLPPIGIAALILISIMIMLTIERTFNDVWYVKIQRRGVKKFLLYWAIITIGPLCVGLSFFVSSYIFSNSIIQTGIALLGIKKILLEIAPFLLTAIGLTILNVIVPNCKVKFRYGFLGGVVSAVFFELAKFGFAQYAYYMSSYRLIYGAIAIIPLFLLWIYISWFIVLAGAILAYAAASTEKTYKGRVLNPYLHALLVLRELWAAQKQGKELSLRQIMEALDGNFVTHTDLILQDLLQAGFIKRTEFNGYVMVFDCEHLTLYEFTNRMPWSLPKSKDLKGPMNKHLQSIKKCLLALDETIQSQLNVPLSVLF